jgi:type VI secretion system protein ImpL
MKKVLKLIFNRWTMAILGLLAISLLIWFVGPLIAIADYRPLGSGTVRWVLIALLLLVYLGKLAWGVIKARRLNERLMDALVKQAPAQAQPGDGPGAEEVALLRKRFEEAVTVLKQAKLGGHGRKRPAFAALTRQQYVYELPWYMFIGAPGSGKTTALINSGLQFPLAERFGQEAIRGIGGTRNCDWWFTDEAVLLDTAGRYTTQESNQEADSAAWTGFLQLLKKYRPRRPVNGVIVTVSVLDLLQQTPAQREAQANAVRKRIQELHEAFNIRFPLYVLVTKADLLAGFMEFFSEYGREERAQAWGTTFPFAENQADAGPLAGFAGEFGALEQRLNDRLVDRMQQERDPHKRALIYTFPQQFSGLKEALDDFLGKVFTPSRFEEKPLLRGVYFTSGTQEGNPIDRVMGNLARALQLERKLLAPNRPSGKSFFLTRLVKDVIFHEAGLAGTSLRWERRRAALQWGALALTGLIAVGATIAWGVSYSRNKAYVAEVSGKAQAVAKQVERFPVTRTTEVMSLLPVLQAVRGLGSTSSINGNKPPLSMTFGLYQGDKLGAAAGSAYQRLLRDALLPRLAMRIEELLRGGGQANSELLYEGLKAYIMLNDPEHLDPLSLKAFITAEWETSLPREVTVEQRSELETHLGHLLDSGEFASPIRADAQLIAAVRNQVAQTPLAQRIYTRLKHQGVGADIPEFNIAKVVGPSAPLVFTRASGQPLSKGVPGLFSYDGYYKAFVQASEDVTRQLVSEESWVLGTQESNRAGLLNPQAKARLLDEVRRLYLQDYATIWEAFINDIKLVRPGSLQESIQAARVLSAVDSPLPVLMRAIVKEVTLVKVDEGDKTVVDKATDKVASTRENLLKMFGQSGERAPTVAVVSRPENIVDDRFDGLRRMVRAAAPGQPAPIDATTTLINELYTLLTATEAAVKAATAPPQSEVPNKIKAEAGRLPEPIRSLLTSLSASGTTQALGATRANLGQALNAAMGDFCNKAIAGRYPFTRNSTRDVTQDDFARLFAPGGLMDEFFQKNLAPYVDTSTRPWSFRQIGDASMGRSSGALQEFYRAQVIRDVFFRSGGRAPAIKLDFKPLEMDASITQFILDIDGQLVKYSHGPQVPVPVQWPGTRGTTQVRLQVSPASASGTSGQVFEGPWALFRMLDRAQISPTSLPEKSIVTFNIDGRKAQFEVISGSVQNPFRLRELEQFNCPGSL